MLLLLETTPQTQGVFMPVWMLGMFGSLFLLLLGIVGFLVKFVLSTFNGIVKDLKTVIDEAVKAFQAFKDEAPKEFVTHPFFSLARQELKEDITRAHKRISETRDELTDHSRNCPAIRFSRAEERT